MVACGRGGGGCFVRLFAAERNPEPSSAFYAFGLAKDGRHLLPVGFSAAHGKRCAYGAFLWTALRLCASPHVSASGLETLGENPDRALAPDGVGVLLAEPK